MQITVIASGSTGNAYRVSDGTTALLLDAGIPIKAIREALNFRVRDLAGCLITHAHGDHVKAAGDLAKAGVDIYGDLLLKLMDRHNASNLQEITVEQAEEFCRELKGEKE